MLRELLVHAFGTPRNHPKSKPFVDHVFSFLYIDGRVWFRNYQIKHEEEDRRVQSVEDLEGVALVEIGPRFCLQPVKVVDGFMGGETIWQNSEYVTPTMARSRKFNAFMKRRVAKEKRKRHEREHKTEETELDRLFL